ncbi:MAG: phosphate uptake regulator PhoU [Desulfurococcales archaeon]|nr:phosphate uptake regulator PhoU [Desulfurococcales archaeon]
MAEAAVDKIRGFVERIHSHVDYMFNDVIRLVEEGVEPGEEFERRLMAVEELRRATTIETLLLIARWQPLGRDLARAEGYIRAAYDLFRIARYLREIVRLNSVAGPLVELGLDSAPLKKAKEMVGTAVKALLEENEELGRLVEDADKDIDDYYLHALKKLSGEKISRRDAVEALLARHVERIADHATYLAKLLEPPTG